MSSATHSATRLEDIAEFVWLEADLLDQRDYKGWLALFAEDSKYVIPVDPEGENYADKLNYAYDGADMRRMRVARLTSGQSMSAANAAHTVRTVSRFRRLDDDGHGNVRVRCAQNLVEFKFGKHRIYAANVTYTLQPADGSFRIVEKVVRLVNSTEALAGMSFLL